MSVISAYEKMFKDGTANRPIRIAQPTPENPNGGMGVASNPMGEALGEQKEDDSSWSQFDSQMEKYISEKRSKKPKTNKKQSVNEGSRIKKLEKRIDLLEGIIEKIMKAQMELLKNG